MLDHIHCKHAADVLITDEMRGKYIVTLEEFTAVLKKGSCNPKQRMTAMLQQHQAAASGLVSSFWHFVLASVQE